MESLELDKEIQELMDEATALWAEADQLEWEADQITHLSLVQDELQPRL